LADIYGIYIQTVTPFFVFFLPEKLFGKSLEQFKTAFGFLS
jgi:hypothetical protein